MKMLRSSLGLSAVSWPTQPPPRTAGSTGAGLLALLLAALVCEDRLLRGFQASFLLP